MTTYTENTNINKLDRNISFSNTNPSYSEP